MASAYAFSSGCAGPPSALGLATTTIEGPKQPVMEGVPLLQLLNNGVFGVLIGLFADHRLMKKPGRKAG